MFGILLVAVLKVALATPGGDATWLMACVVPLSLLILIPALRGYLNWPIRVRLDSAGGTLATRSLLLGQSVTGIASIHAMAATKYWHGGRAMCNGLVLHLAAGRRIILSEGNLGHLEALHEALLKLDIPELTKR
ncbi:MAG: hypothetical protein ABI599_18615 [Flavobacteriales bacterium]